MTTGRSAELECKTNDVKANKARIFAEYDQCVPKIFLAQLINKINAELKIQTEQLEINIAKTPIAALARLFEVKFNTLNTSFNVELKYLQDDAQDAWKEIRKLYIKAILIEQKKPSDDPSRFCLESSDVDNDVDSNMLNLVRSEIDGRIALFSWEKFKEALSRYQTETKSLFAEFQEKWTAEFAKLAALVIKESLPHPSHEMADLRMKIEKLTDAVNELTVLVKKQLSNGMHTDQQKSSDRFFSST